MALCDASGNVVDSYNYDAFGAIRSSTGSQANPFTFTGEQTDASTGLEYLRARYYDAASGSFISRDAMPGLNRFAYGGGNPVGNVDPSGLLCYSQEAYDKIAGEMSPLGGAVAEQWDKNKQQILAAMSQAGICGGDGSIQ
jgi:RHS repeat-associated protein